MQQTWQIVHCSSLLPHQGGMQYPSTGFCTLTKTMMKARDSEGQHHARVDMTQHRLCSTETAHAHGPCRGRHHERRRIWLQKCPAKGCPLFSSLFRISFIKSRRAHDPLSQSAKVGPHQTGQAPPDHRSFRPYHLSSASSIQASTASGMSLPTPFMLGSRSIPALRL